MANQAARPYWLLPIEYTGDPPTACWSAPAVLGHTRSAVELVLKAAVLSIALWLKMLPSGCRFIGEASVCIGLKGRSSMPQRS